MEGDISIAVECGLYRNQYEDPLLRSLQTRGKIGKVH